MMAACYGRCTGPRRNGRNGLWHIVPGPFRHMFRQSLRSINGLRETERFSVNPWHTFVRARARTIRASILPFHRSDLSIIWRNQELKPEHLPERCWNSPEHCSGKPLPDRLNDRRKRPGPSSNSKAIRGGIAKRGNFTTPGQPTVIAVLFIVRSGPTLGFLTTVHADFATKDAP